MATSTLIQSLDTKDSAGGTIGATVSNRRQIEVFFAGAAIVAGEWVALDLSKSGATRAVTVVKTPAAAGAVNVIGVALGSASTGEKVSVVVEGYVEGASVVSGVLQGEGLGTSGATAGRAIKYVPGTHNTLCGMALENAAAGNTAAVLVFKQAF